jgi:hypothetical protein
MTTAEYIKQFQALNSPTGGIPEEIKLRRLAFTHAARVAPMLDLTQPEVVEEHDPEYVAPVKTSRRAASGARSEEKVANLEARLAELIAENAQLVRRIHEAGLDLA